MNTTVTLLAGGGLVALGGLAVALIDVVRDKSGQSHEKGLAREARRQDRLEQAYLELGIYLARQDAWARSVRPYWGQPPVPDPLPPAERWRVQTLVTNYGSPEVQRLLDVWAEVARKIENADEVIGRADRARGPAPEVEQEANREALALPEYRNALHEAAENIRPDERRAGWAASAGREVRLAWPLPAGGRVAQVSVTQAGQA